MTADPRWGCRRKRRYDDERHAKRVLRIVRESGREGVDELHVYLCDAGCGGWHIGRAGRVAR